MSAGTQSARIPGQWSGPDALAMLDDRILAMIIAQDSLPRTLTALCSEIERQQPDLFCSILLLDPDGVTLRTAAAPSLPASYSRAVEGLKAGACAGSCGTAVFRRVPVIVSDIATDPLWDSFRDLALPLGLRACWSTPISSRDGTIHGTFAVYYRESRSPDAQHTQLVAHATRLAAIAIERDRDKNELRAAEDRYRTLVERLPAITYVAELGASGRWHYVSPQIQSILGFSPGEWLSDPWNWINRIYHEDREIAFAAERQFQETRQVFHAEYRMVARDGRLLWFRDEGVMLPGDETGMLMQGVLYDITDQKRLEEQLRHSQKMEAVGQLAGGVAHDFNNLLMLIHAHNERLRGRFLPEDPAHTDTLEIEQAVTQAAGLTRQLLAFSRRQLLQLRFLDLNNVLGEMSRMLERLIVDGVTLEVLPSSSPQFVKADPGQLGQVILNLAVNARDAMPDGGRLTIQTRGVKLDQPAPAREGTIPPGKYVVLSVSDTGAGMSGDVLGRIFEPFFTTKKPGQGTGLGLAIVYGVIKQTGGWICVNSEPGQGTAFEIYFPEAEQKREAYIQKKPSGVPSVARGTETILLVEDQEGIRELVHEVLKRRGYNVLCAPDGNEALRVASEHDGVIDLLVTDIIMPNLGGQDLASRLSKARPRLKVVFMSGNPDKAFLNGDLNAGAVVLQKPFPLETLLHKVRSILDQ
jgi:two-component system, cell cycle sensor histidine kinase and response regulator CckA